MGHHLSPMGTYGPRLAFRDVMLRFRVQLNLSIPWSQVPLSFPPQTST